MAYTFDTGKGHVTSYRGTFYAYVRRNFLGRWVTTSQARATHKIHSLTKIISEV